MQAVPQRRREVRARFYPSAARRRTKCDRQLDWRGRRSDRRSRGANGFACSARLAGGGAGRGGVGRARAEPVAAPCVHPGGVVPGDLLGHRGADRGEVHDHVESDRPVRRPQVGADPGDPLDVALWRWTAEQGFDPGAARAANARGGDLFIVEGYLDVITLAQFGFGGAVAPLGTALTKEQLDDLFKHYYKKS